MKKKNENQSEEEIKQGNLRKEFTASFYRNNKTFFIITIMALIVCSIMEIAVAYLLQVLLDVANGNDASKLWDVLAISAAFLLSKVLKQRRKPFIFLTKRIIH